MEDLHYNNEDLKDDGDDGEMMIDDDEMDYDTEDNDMDYDTDDEGYYVTDEDDDAFYISNVTRSENEYKVIDAESLVNEQQEKIFSVAETLGISVEEAGTLLRYFSWDREKLYNEYFENSQELCKKAGVIIHKTPYLIESDENNKIEMRECDSCYEEVKSSEMLSLPCKHFMCKGCWIPYLTYAIEDGRLCTRKLCPFPNCNMIVSEALFKAVVAKKDFERYRHFQARSFVDDNPNIKWCPAPECGRAVFCEKKTKSVLCSCGTKFCFKCQELDHAPCTCEELVEWRSKERDDSETGNWIVANTKSCPKCNGQIEKDGGCNHMSCSQCSYEFCWICLDEWKNHSNQTGGYYACNRYKAEELGEKLESSSRNEARRALEKYMAYYTNFVAHRESAKFEKRLKDISEAKMKDLHEVSSKQNWSDIDFIGEGINQLIECRNVLKYTYIHGYFLPNETSEKNMFEHLQSELQKETEHLSQLLESGIDRYDRSQIINVTQSAKMRRINLLQGCEEGLI